jgi:uncharacterized protein (DUF1810 family)
VTADPWNLERFVQAQDRLFDGVREELRRGRKQSHWMWFVFPQIEGLGHSSMSERYAISGLDEARAYLAHPVLGARLRECVRLVLEAPGEAESIFGSVDAMKLRSSMTLFHHAAPDDEAFAAVLVRFWGGSEDLLTLARL